MQYRFLGKQRLRVSALGLGCMGMSEFYGPTDDARSRETIAHALGLGLNFFDTADMYGPFANERLLGGALKHCRDEVVIATKFGYERNERGEYLGINGRPEYVRRACEASLRRLGVAHIDLYYLHRVDPSVPIEETVGAMSELVEAGKVRYLGLSEANAATIRRAHAVHAIAALQTEYSLWTRDVETDILPTLRELGIGFVPYSPLGKGFLSGAITRTEDLSDADYRRQLPRFQYANFRHNLALIARIQRLAKAKDVTPAQLALAWVMAKGEDLVPIPGTTKTAHLDENIGALRLELSVDDLKMLEQALLPQSVAGERYGPAAMLRVNL